MTDSYRKPIRARLVDTRKNTATLEPSGPYRTASTELAAFLKASGHPMLSFSHDGVRVWFVFDATPQRSASASATAFSEGEEVSATALFQHWREVMDVVNQTLRKSGGQE